MRLGIGLSTLVVLELLLELDDDQGEVVADELRASDDQEATDEERGRDHDHQDGGARTERAVEQCRQRRTPGRADEEHVDATIPQRSARATDKGRRIEGPDVIIENEVRRSTALGTLNTA